MPFSAGVLLVSGPLPQSLRIEVSSSNHDYGTLFVIQLEAATMAHESPNPWTTTLPAVLLGIRSVVKGASGKSAAEVIYVMTLRFFTLLRIIQSTLTLIRRLFR